MSLFIRSQVLEAIRTTITATTWPVMAESVNGPQMVIDFGDTLPEERIEFNDVVGNIKVPVIRSSDQVLADEFQVTLLVTTEVHGRTRPQAEGRVCSITGALFDQLCVDPALGGTVTGLIHCVPTGSIRGPRAFSIPSVGYGAQIIITLSCKTRG